MDVVQVILEQVLLRREKTTLDSEGNRIVQLPPKEVCSGLNTVPHSSYKPTQIVVDVLKFSSAERKFYDTLFVTAKHNFDELNRQGLVSKNYTNILAMLMKFVLS